MARLVLVISGEGVFRKPSPTGRDGHLSLTVSVRAAGGDAATCIEPRRATLSGARGRMNHRGPRHAFGKPQNDHGD
jgi:hypothetical protein